MFVFNWLFTDSRDGGDDLSELQFVQDRRLSSCVQANWKTRWNMRLKPQKIGDYRFYFAQSLTYFKSTVSFTSELKAIS